MLIQPKKYIGGWERVNTTNPALFRLWSKHYSFNKEKKRKNYDVSSGGCHRLGLLHKTGKAGFVWMFPKTGFLKNRAYCMFFRNEGAGLSSELIITAEQAAHYWCKAHLPDNEKNFNGITFIDGTQVHGNGACFRHAGWKLEKTRTKKNNLIVRTKKF